MQQPQSFAKRIMPLFVVFIIVNSIILLLQKQFYQNNIDALVVFTANYLLFIMSSVTIAMHLKAFNKKNPNASVRSVMGATLMKLVVLGGSAIVYLAMAGANRSLKAILGGMILYVVYTVVEVRIATKLNEK
ncbi:MAG: hypothetical protein KGO81_10375 [Bacteroidota bacterium]|nr:hypothetical protein [Bacteroidota bacterium]